MGRATAEVGSHHVRSRDLEQPRGRPAALLTRTRAVGLSPSVSLPLGRGLEALASFEVSRERARRAEGDSSATEAALSTFSATPGLRLALPGRGRLRVETELAWRNAEGPWSRLAPFLRRVDQVGVSRLARAGGEYKLQDKVTLNVSLTMGSTPGRRRVTEGSMDLTAYF